MCINFLIFFILSSVFCLLSPPSFVFFFFFFLFVSLSLCAALSLSLCSALSPSVSSQQLGGGGGGCGLSMARWKWLWVVNRLVEVVWVGGFPWWVVSGSVGDGGLRRWWGFCLGLPAVMGFPDLISLSLLVRGCRQNGLWWVWVCQRGYGGCGFGFAGVGVGVMGGCYWSAAVGLVGVWKKIYIKKKNYFIIF